MKIVKFVFCAACVLLILIVLLVYLLYLSVSWATPEDMVPSTARYHTAYELQQATGVEFPEVSLVDSTKRHVYDMWSSEVETFVPVKPLSKEFFKRLDRACKEDPCCWMKEENGYRYTIYPEFPLDRTKGSHRRMVKDGDGMVEDWQGDFVEVWVPFSGDTITIEDGWRR